MRTFEDFLSSPLNPRQLSREQLEVVYSDKATVVSAGAGSGKTTVLSYRFLRLLLLEDEQRRAGVDGILTLTFTRKAAAEMYERIFRLVSMLCPHFPCLENEVRNFRKAHISTMDSFASEIARTDCMRYGITRDFSILDNDRRAELVKNVTASLFADEKDLMTLLSRIVNPVDIALDVFSLLDRRFDIVSGFDDAGQEGLFDDFLSSLGADVRRRILDVLGRLAVSPAPSASSLPSFLDESDPAYHERLAGAVRSGDYSLLVPISLRKGFVNSGPRKELSDRIKADARTYNALYPLLVSVGTLRNDGSRSGLYRLFAAFLSRIGDEKRRLGVLTFKDVEAMALEILKTNGRVRSYYKHKFRYIMIDEFQDNSVRQKELLYILSEKEDVDGRGVPPLCDLDSSKLFFVGDAKQSIYLFRGADVSVFNGLKDEIASIGGNILSMSTNYRSEPALIDHFNSLFGFVFPHEEESEPCDEELDGVLEHVLKAYGGTGRYHACAESMGGRPASDGVLPKILFARSRMRDGEDGDDESLSWTENEAEYIVGKIMRMVSSDDYLIPSQSGPRRPGYGDIAILYRNSSSQIPLEKAFRRNRIPYTIVESTSITVEAMISDFYSFLNLVVQPRDKVSYFNVLRSPFARISDKGLLFFSSFKDCYELPYDCFSTVPDTFCEEDVRRFGEVRALYGEICRICPRVPLEKVVSHLYYRGGYFSYLSANLELSSFEDHYEYIWEMARDKADLVGFLSYVRNVVQERDRMDINLLHLKADGVRMMTIHKSKGLEFPIVFACGITTSPVAGKGIVIDDPSVPFFALDTSLDCGVKKLVFSRYRRLREDAEMKRILYVALTRASSHLVVIMSEKKRSGKKSMACLYEKALMECGADVSREVFDVLSEDEVPSSRIVLRTDEAFHRSAIKPLSPCRIASRGIKELGHLGDELYKDQEGRRALPEFSRRVDGILSSTSAWDLFGTLCHQALECMFRKIPFSLQADGRVDDDEMAELSDAALEVARKFFASGFYEKEVKGFDVDNELRFYTVSGQDIAVGSADLVVFKKDHNLVVDYKSDKYYDPDYHKGQLTGYAKAMEAIYSKPCLCRVFYLRSMEAGPLWDSDGNLI